MPAKWTGCIVLIFMFLYVHKAGMSIYEKYVESDKKF